VFSLIDRNQAGPIIGTLRRATCKPPFQPCSTPLDPSVLHLPVVG
jgi:hypothetical protein